MTGETAWPGRVISSDLTAIERDDAGGEQQRLAQQFAHVDIHADGEEENAEQQSLERLDGGFDRLAVFGFGKKQPGDEGAERHRQAGLIGNNAGRDDHEQGGGDEQIARARRRHQSEQRLQQDAAEHDDDGERQRGLQERPAKAAKHRAAGACREQRNEHQNRNDREILQQQNGKAGAADIGLEAALVR